PHDAPKFEEADLVHLEAAISLDTPAEIRAPPRGKAMAAGGGPEKTEKLTHSIVLSDVVLLQQMPEAAIRQLEQIGGARLDAAGLAQRRLDKVALQTGDVTLQVNALGRNGGGIAGPGGGRGGAGARPVDRDLD